MKENVVEGGLICPLAYAKQGNLKQNSMEES